MCLGGLNLNNKLKDLIKSAQGDRSQNEFALHANISSAALTRILKGERKPDPDTLRKIAEKAYNGITYKELLLATGYLDGIDDVIDKDIIEQYIKVDKYEKELLRFYSMLNDNGKVKVIEYISDLIETNKYKKGDNEDRHNTNNFYQNTELLEKAI